MITIILLVVVILGILLFKKGFSNLLTFMLIVIGSMFLLGSLIASGTSSYNFKKFKIQRDSFEQTLKTARENGNPIETAAIVKEVSNWNIELASAKFDNTIFLLDEYIDDRIESLEPIK